LSQRYVAELEKSCPGDALFQTGALKSQQPNFSSVLANSEDTRRPGSFLLIYLKGTGEDSEQPNPLAKTVTTARGFHRSRVPYREKGNPMTNLVDLGFHRFEKLSAGYAETLRHELVLIQAIDISNLNGRELRKLRDRLLRIKWLLVVCDPKTRERIANRMDDVTPPTTLEELARYVPEPPTVRFI
jgi:hypothetical protein